MRKTTLSFIAIITIIAIAGTSCKKSSSSTSSGSQITCTIDGTNVTFSSNAGASVITSGGSTLTQVEATNSANAFVIAITSSSAVNTSDTYTDAGNAAVLSETDLTGTTVTGISAYVTTPNVKVNFTNITSTNLTGTFSGSMAATSGGTAMIITNGTFNVPLH